MIWRTPAYVDYHWLAQPDLDKRFGNGFTEKLKTVFLNMNQKSLEGKEILELFGAKKFVPTQAYKYNDIERIGRQLGKIR